MPGLLPSLCAHRPVLRGFRPAGRLEQHRLQRVHGHHLCCLQPPLRPRPTAHVRPHKQHYVTSSEATGHMHTLCRGTWNLECLLTGLMVPAASTTSCARARTWWSPATACMEGEGPSFAFVSQILSQEGSIPMAFLYVHITSRARCGRLKAACVLCVCCVQCH